MTTVIYPTDKTEKIYQNLNSSYSEFKFVKMKSFNERKCVTKNILQCLSVEYQNYNNTKLRESFEKDFITEMKNFLMENGDYTESEIVSKFSRVKNPKFEVIGGKNIFSTMIKDLNSGETFPVLEEKTKRNFSSTSRIFQVLSLSFISDMLEQRYTVMKLRDSEDKDSKEIYYFNLMKENSLQPNNLIEILGDETCSNQKIIINLISTVLKFNVFVCRSWNEEISVLDFYFVGDELPFIILFKTEGKISLTGIPADGFNYESGGVALGNLGIKTVFSPVKDKEIYDDLMKLTKNDVDSYYLEKYFNYLNKMKNNVSLEGLRKNYDAPEVEELIKPEMVETIKPEVVELIKPEMVETIKPEVDELIKPEMVETIKPEIEKNKYDKMKELEEIISKENQVKEILKTDNIYIPAFIRGFTDDELIYLLKRFVSNKINLKQVGRKKLELEYKNYIESVNFLEDVDDVIERVDSQIV